MQEVAYHISTGLSAKQYKKKKEPYPALPLWIRLYEINSLMHAKAKMEEFKRFTFGTRSFSTYDRHCLVGDLSIRVYHPWIHGACH